MTSQQLADYIKTNWSAQPALAKGDTGPKLGIRSIETTDLPKKRPGWSTKSYRVIQSSTSPASMGEKHELGTAHAG